MGAGEAPMKLVLITIAATLLVVAPALAQRKTAKQIKQFAEV